MALLRALIPPAPAGGSGAAIRQPHHYITRLQESVLCRAIFQMSRSLRSLNFLRLGEERIRSLVHGLPVLLMFCFLTSYAAGAAPASAAEEISAIIQAEIAVMPEWQDADIRVEITVAVKHEPDESFRLASEGLTIGRRNVIAPIEVVRSGKVVRSLSVPAVVRAGTTAIVAARKISAGEMITADDMRESRVETTEIGSVLTRDPKEIAGKIAQRAFAAGVHLPVDGFSEPPLVRRGDMINLRLEREGIVLTSSVRAEENGRFGEFIRVKNVDFSSVVRARVTGRSEVTIQ